MEKCGFFKTCRTSQSHCILLTSVANIGFLNKTNPHHAKTWILKDNQGLENLGLLRTNQDVLRHMEKCDIFAYLGFLNATTSSSDPEKMWSLKNIQSLDKRGLFGFVDFKRQPRLLIVQNVAF